MGLLLCEICGEEFGGVNPHVCDPVKIVMHIQELIKSSHDAMAKTDNMRNAVFMLLQSLPSVEGEEVTVKTKWLKDLWAASGAVFYKPSSMEEFHQKWMALHLILSRSFDLFRDRKSNGTLQDKLKRLRTVCDNAKEVMGYQDSKFDLSPEDLV